MGTGYRSVWKRRWMVGYTLGTQQQGGEWLHEQSRYKIQAAKRPKQITTESQFECYGEITEQLL